MTNVMSDIVSPVLLEDILYTLSKLNIDEQRKLRNSSIIITGCAGFLGYYFMCFFATLFDELGLKSVIGLDNFILGRPIWIDRLCQNKKIRVLDFDIIKDDINDIPDATKADYVIHMASIASPTFYRKYPIETIDANVWGLRKLLDFYCQKDLAGFLFYSSSEIYGDPDSAHIPTSEDYYGNVLVNGPRSCYDEAKRFCETMCMLFCLKYNMPIGVSRPFNNYGAGMRLNDRRVPADFAKSIYENKDINILSDGVPTRTFCYIADAIAGYLKILLHGRYDYFNIGIEEPEISIRELAEIYKHAGRDVFSYSGEIRFSISPDKEYLTNNPQRRCPNISKARKILGYEPSISVEDGVYRFLLFLRENERGDFLW